MRTLKLLFLFMVMAGPCFAQIGGGQTNVGGGALVQTFAGVPSGTCSKAALAVNTTNGNLYTCLAGVWTLVSGGGGGTVSSGTVNTIAKYTGTTTVGNSLLDDGGTTANTLTYAGSGGISSTPSGGVGGTITLPEGTAPAAATGKDILYADSTAHCAELSLNNGAFNCIATAASNLSIFQGLLQSAQEPAHTGDITNSSGSLVMTLPTVNSNVGSFTNASVTVNAKGQVTAAANGISNAAVASTSAVTSSNPTINTDQQLIELSLAAGYLNTAHQPFIIHGGGTYSSTTASSPALTFKIKLCTVSGCGSGTVVTLVNIVSTTLNTTALTNATWNIGATAVTNTTGATGNLVVKGHPGLVLDLGAAVSAADAVFADTNTATSSNIDLTAALFVDFTVAQSATGASNSYTQMMGMLGPVAGTGPQGPAGPAGSTSQLDNQAPQTSFTTGNAAVQNIYTTTLASGLAAGACVELRGQASSNGTGTFDFYLLIGATQVDLYTLANGVNIPTNILLCNKPGVQNAQYWMFIGGATSGINSYFGIAAINFATSQTIGFGGKIAATGGWEGLGYQVEAQ